MAGYYVRGIAEWKPFPQKALGWVTERRGIETGNGAIVSQYPAAVTTAANRKSRVCEATGSR